MELFGSPSNQADRRYQINIQKPLLINAILQNIWHIHSVVSKSDKDIVHSPVLSVDDIYQLWELPNALVPLCAVMQGTSASIYSTIDGTDLDTSEDEIPWIRRQGYTSRPGI